MVYMLFFFLFSFKFTRTIQSNSGKF